MQNTFLGRLIRPFLVIKCFLVTLANYVKLDRRELFWSRPSTVSVGGFSSALRDKEIIRRPSSLTGNHRREAVDRRPGCIRSTLFTSLSICIRFLAEGDHYPGYAETIESFRAGHGNRALIGYRLLPYNSSVALDGDRFLARPISAATHPVLSSRHQSLQ